MQITGEAVAQRFLKLSETGMTQIKLQRLVYFAQAWSLGTFNAPLFEEDFQAWSFGPILPSLNEIYSEHGRIVATIPVPGTVIDMPEDKVEFIQSVWEQYGYLRDDELEESSKDDVWRNSRGGMKRTDKSDNIMPKEEIREYYAEISC